VKKVTTSLLAILAQSKVCNNNDARLLFKSNLEFNSMGVLNQTRRNKYAL